jgi:dihydrofolate reductase
MIIMIAASENALEKQWIGFVYPTILKGSKSHFRTSYHYGAKTFESPKPLPNRTHIVISRQENY